MIGRPTTRDGRLRDSAGKRTSVATRVPPCHPFHPVAQRQWLAPRSDDKDQRLQIIPRGSHNFRIKGTPVRRTVRRTVSPTMKKREACKMTRDDRPRVHRVGKERKTKRRRGENMRRLIGRANLHNWRRPRDETVAQFLAASQRSHQRRDNYKRRGGHFYKGHGGEETGTRRFRAFKNTCERPPPPG